MELVPNQPQQQQPPKKMSFKDKVALPAELIPSFRTAVALQDECADNLLLRTWGGLGDQLCSEPTLRWALKNFKTSKLSLASQLPQAFSHLPFQKVYDLNEVQPNYEKFLLFDMIKPVDHITWEFISHMLINCVEYPSLCAFRSQIPVSDREIHLVGQQPKTNVFDVYMGDDAYLVVVHPGKHWPSKTFPKWWWDGVIRGLVAHGLVPVIIGADADDNRSTVDVDTTGCLDMRNKLSIMESVWLLQRADVLLTNDSSPMHMAASRDPNADDRQTCHIGYVATCKHPDFITHWRMNDNGKLEFQYREHNFGKGGVWDIVDTCPNKENEVSAEFVPQDVLESWLPQPLEVMQWVESVLGT